MSLYGEYVLEREGLSILETDNGFTTYKIIKSKSGKKQIYVSDIYVKEDKRRSKIAKKMVDELHKLAKKAGCDMAFTQIDLTTATCNEALKFQLSCGMSILKAEGQILQMFKMLD